MAQYLCTDSRFKILKKNVNDVITNIRNGFVNSSRTFDLSKSYTKLILVSALFCYSLSHGLRGNADVLESDNMGFTVSNSVVIRDVPERVYGDFKKIDKWWDSKHTFRGVAKNLKLDARPGGCFCEYFDESHGVVHLRVIHVDENELVRFSGALGPLQTMGAIGTLTVRFTKTENDTVLSFDYIVIGRKLTTIAEAVDRVLLGQMHRLKKFSENGDPDFQD